SEGSGVGPGSLRASGLLPPASPGPERGEVQLDSSWSQDGDLQGCGPLDMKWVLWHEFMKEHAHLDAWLRLAEQAVSSPNNSAHVTYAAAKEELRKFERLRGEAGSRLVQLDGLTQRGRALTRLSRGAVRARLLGAARESGRRWDRVNARLETITHTLQVFVSEWEGFEAEWEELTLWLADLDLRLSEVEQLTGNTCDKMRQLQALQQCVCVHSERVNGVLRRGEALMQRSEPPDARELESRVLQLLRHCTHTFNCITRTHTRLLSMRLVFEDDCILSQAPDSGCPSETLLEDEGALDKPHLDLPAPPHPARELGFNQLGKPPSPWLLLPPPPSPSPPTHEHLGLEWDPSVDIGGSVSRDDADSSYFSANTGLYRDGLKRRSYLSSLGSQSDITNDITNQEADL
ncbi:nesprin-2, partial [Centroberyx affinis]|uniref:nesprin-2 n=1 Tax=Centroberyx affinis TaxID=166261 RepID=UPI003A5C3F79